MLDRDAVDQALGAVSQRDEFFAGQWRRIQIRGHFQICADGMRFQAGINRYPSTDPLPGFPFGRLTSSNEGTWVFSHQASSTAPQTSQDAPPVWGTKNFVSVRLYSAPQLHRTIVAMLRICANGRSIQAGIGCHNQTDPPPPLLLDRDLARYRRLMGAAFVRAPRPKRSGGRPWTGTSSTAKASASRLFAVRAFLISKERRSTNLREPIFIDRLENSSAI